MQNVETCLKLFLHPSQKIYIHKLGVFNLLQDTENVRIIGMNCLENVFFILEIDY